MTTRVLMLFLASVVLYSCGSTIQTFEEALNSEIESTPIIPLAIDGIKDELDSDLLDNKFIAEYGSLENPLYNDKLDSIYGFTIKIQCGYYLLNQHLYEDPKEWSTGNICL
jgi:hypothetical protein